MVWKHATDQQKEEIRTVLYVGVFIFNVHIITSIDEDSDQDHKNFLGLLQHIDDQIKKKALKDVRGSTRSYDPPRSQN